MRRLSRRSTASRSRPEETGLNVRTPAGRTVTASMMVLAGMACIVMAMAGHGAVSAAAISRPASDERQAQGDPYTPGGRSFLVAQASSSGSESSGEGGGEGEAFGKTPNALNTAATAAIANGLQAAAQICEGAGSAARVGCLASEIAKVAATVPPGIEYRGLRIELNRIASDLDRVVRANDGPDMPRTPSGYGQVTEENIVRAAAEAVAVIDEAQTRLLRSSEASRLRRNHYVTVARSLESGKRLLRSS